MISAKLIEQLEKVLSQMPAEWDGRKAILEMRSAGYPHWKQMEWIGFYFQFLCDTKLPPIMQVPGPKYGRVEFDGFAETTAKSVLHGQYPITFIEYPWIDRATSLDELIRLLRDLKYKKEPNYVGRDYWIKELEDSKCALLAFPH